MDDRLLEAAATRRVQERNGRGLRLESLEEKVRLRVEDGLRSSTSSIQSSNAGDCGARDRLVVVDQSQAHRNALAYHRCSNCHDLGHRSSDCSTVVTFNVDRRRPRRRRHTTTGHMRY